MPTLDELFSASRAGDALAAQRLLEQSPQLATARGRHPAWGGEPTALHVAVENERIDIVRLLLDAGADPNPPSESYDGWTPLLIAATRGVTPIVQLLLTRGARVGAWEAAALGDVVKLAGLLDETPTLAAVRGPNDAPPLHFAATVGVARFLIERGAPVDALDKYESTAARAAAYSRSWRAVGQFLMRETGERDAWLLAAIDDVDGLAELNAAGIDVCTAYRDGINPASGFGESPLHTAAALGNVATVEFLVRLGAHADGGSRDATPLHYAAKLGSREMVDALLAAGADPRRRDTEHRATPADWARFFGNFQLAAYLEEIEA
jgi:ankyrin repeat protein